MYETGSTHRSLERGLVLLEHVAAGARPASLAATAPRGFAPQHMWSVEQRVTGEGTSIATWIDGAIRIAAKREADGPVRVVQDVNAARPIYCTAVGKALAAWRPKLSQRLGYVSETGPAAPLRS